MVYRLTPKAQVFFPRSTNATTIDILHAANRLFVATAGGEVDSARVFALGSQEGMRKLRGKTVLELAEMLVKIRDQEGYMSELSTADPIGIVEYHSPIFDLLDAFPLVLERLKPCKMVERISRCTHGERKGGSHIRAVPLQVYISVLSEQKRHALLWILDICSARRKPRIAQR